MPLFVHRSRIPAPAEAVFRWHQRPGALERLTPPFDPIEILERSGDRVVFLKRLGPLRLRWTAGHRGTVEGREFRDVQVRGPFARWEHLHRFEPAGPGACLLEDRIDYALPAWALPGSAYVRRRLEKAFAYRHRVTAADVPLHARYPGPPLRILVTGSSGLVGSALVPFLTAGGHEVARLVRRGAGIPWDPASGRIEAGALEGFDAVVHLAGETVAGRWTEAKKDAIRASRLLGTQLLSQTLAGLERPPRVLVSASAVGVYGDRGDEVLTEDSPQGEGFLARVCHEWEGLCTPAHVRGIRVVNLRFGILLSPSGGALARMLPPFRLGLGGRVGSGLQWWSWAALDDALAAILHAVRTEGLRGPVNVCAPGPVTNRDFTRILGRVLGRPALLPLPAFAARLALGEMADAALLASARVLPRRLEEGGFRFAFPGLEGALQHLLDA